jgi:hypothetical protein
LFGQAVYYVDTAGFDGNNGTSTSTPWKTVAKVNSSQGAIPTGSQVLFKRGHTWHESLTPTKSGVTYGAYGSGAKPVITGLEQLTSWTTVGTNIYESTAFSSLTSCNIVTINNNIARRGREPDYNEPGDYGTGIGGYKKITASTANTVTASSFSNSPNNWTGADAVIRAVNWVMDTVRITAHSTGGQLTLRRNVAKFPTVGNGFFITNDVRTLDQHGEWYYNPTTKKLRIYLSTAPSNYIIKASDMSTVVNINNVSNITLDNLHIEGSNGAVANVQMGLIDIQSTSGLTDNITIQNCELFYAGSAAVDGRNVNLASIDNTRLLNNYVYEIMNFGFDMRGFGNGTIITGNTLRKIAMWEGFNSTGGSQSSNAIYTDNGTGNRMTDNRLDSLGYLGLRFGAENDVQVLRNVVDGFCMILTDGSGIYGGFSGDTSYTATGRIIKHNIVLNGRTITPNGVTVTSGRAAGIYLDNNAYGIVVDSNVVGRIDSYGMLLSNIRRVTITNNLVFDARIVMQFQQAVMASDTVPHRVSKENIVRNNIFVARARYSDQNQLVMGVNNNSYAAYISEFGDQDLNVFARPTTDPNNTVYSSATSGLITQWREKGGAWNFHNLAQWKAATIHDDSSTNSPLHYPGANLDTCSLFLYNTGDDDTTITISEQYIDMLGTVYNPPSVTLKPYSGKFLLATNIAPPPSNATPVAVAGNDQTATLPYPTIATTTINPTADTYVRDGTSAALNFGTLDTVAVKTSSGGPNYSRRAFFKFDLSSFDDVDSAKFRIYGRQLDFLTVQPNVSLYSVATDSWVETTMTWNNQPAHGASALDVKSITPTQQYYEFDASAFAVSEFAGDKTVSLVLRDAGTQNVVTSYRSRESSTNKPQLVVQSISYLTLNGSNSYDTDGTITYLWTKQSGPSGGTIANAGSAIATVTDFQAGTYVYRLTVTDDDGATAYDELTILVTPSATPNVNPTVSAGDDQTVALPTTQVTVTATANDTDGTIASYQWSKISGGAATITAATSASTTITGLAEGNYVFRIVATDDDGATALDDITVTVNAAVEVSTEKTGVKVNGKGQKVGSKILSIP